jgi:hypothetical protein
MKKFETSFQEKAEISAVFFHHKSQIFRISIFMKLLQKYLTNTIMTF